MNLGWDAPQIFSTSVLPGDGAVETRARIQNVFSAFVREFRFGQDFVYRDALHQNLLIQQYFLEVDLVHLSTYNEHLAGLLVERPADYLPLFESAIRDLGKQMLSATDVPDCQVMLLSNANPVPLRALDSSQISKLVRIPGIIIGASAINAKATVIHAMCKTCRHVKLFSVNPGFAGINLPRVCDGPKDQNTEACPVDPYIIVHDKSIFVDQQTIKLQELPDMIPIGELPRHIQMTCDRYLANKVVPGTRVTITGLFTSSATKPSKMSAVAVRMAYIRVVGMQVDVDGTNRLGRAFSEDEEEEYIQMSRRPNLYQEFCKSIAPGIYGAEDIKKAIACLLMGGSRKVLPDGIRLRGDVNVLLLGDPGIAKSQLLKFVENVAPIAVYTSGKGSSAAGLTASVVRDPGTREFYLEGGAMVLADGGVVCIDEFDKMREEDRVAIHEAMEQQTISIAKAGITTILNSRTSVLAAANPVFGRYDDMKSPGENIEFQSTILSRFDLIFIVRDEHNEEKDKKIARHVMDIHTNHKQTDLGSSDFDIQKMRGYIGYCRAKCAPRLSASAADKLISHFVEVRGKVKEMRKDVSGARNGVPITVRQLEAIIRISESFAKMTLSPVATDRHVDEAIRLFNISTLHAIQSGPGGEGVYTPEYTKQVDSAQAYILRRLARGSQVSYARLKSDLEAQSFTESVIDRAVYSLTHKQVLEFKDRRLNVVRIG